MIASMDEQAPFWVWPKICDSDVFESEELLRLWLWILSNTQKERAAEQYRNGWKPVTIELAPGQCPLNREQAATELRWTRRTLSRRLQVLVERSCIAIHPRKPFAVIEVLNWRRYQTVNNSQVCPPSAHQDEPANHGVFDFAVPQRCPPSAHQDLTPSYPRVLTLESDDWTDPITGEFDVDRIRLPTEVSSLRVSRAFSQLAILKQKKGDPLTPEKARVWIRRLVEIGEEKGYFALRDAVERESKKKAPPKKYEYTDTFQKWWATYPSLRRTNKPKAFDQYKAAIERLLETEKVTIDGQPGTIEIASREAAEQFLLRRVTAYAKSPRGQSQFSPEPERWLRNAKFLEGREAWSVGDDETTPVKDREFRRAPPPT